MEFPMKLKNKIITGILGFLILSTPGVSQNIQAVWEEYLNAETRYQTLKAQVHNLAQQQEQLHRKQQRLQDKQTWYNGWIIKMQLSGVSEDLVSVADSLQAVREQLQKTEQMKSDRFREFKQLYLAKAEKGSGSEDLEGEWADQADLIIRTVANSNNPYGALPDYSEIVNKLYEDKQTRQLVLSDLREVIIRKISYIDTLVASRRSDLALMKSMADFRKDVNLQTQSDADLSRSGATRVNFTAESGSPETDYTYLGRGPDEQNPSPVSTDLTVQSSQNIVVNETSIQADIQQLQHRRTQYQELLRTIEKELHH